MSLTPKQIEMIREIRLTLKRTKSEIDLLDKLKLYLDLSLKNIDKLQKELQSDDQDT